MTMTHRVYALDRTRTALVPITAFACLVMSTPLSAAAQGAKCRAICAPTFTFMPGGVTTDVMNAPKVRSLKTGQVQTLPSKTNLELIGSLVFPTALPRTSLYVSVQWLPTAKTAENPFTLYTAHEVGDSIRANQPSVSLGASFGVLTPKQTSGWFGLNFNVADLYSAAARPNDTDVYTHKLDFDLVGTLNVFSKLPASNYFHGVGVYGILDWVATGLPHAGDEVPKGERVFVNDARPFTLIAGLSLPVAPLFHKEQ
jgi:hypothetical protein